MILKEFLSTANMPVGIVDGLIHEDMPFIFINSEFYDFYEIGNIFSESYLNLEVAEIRWGECSINAYVNPQ